MSLTVYEAPRLLANEQLRDEAVLASGVLDAADDSQMRWMVESIRRTMRTTNAAISIMHQEWQYLVVTSGIEPGVNARRTSFCGHAIVGDEPVFCVLDATLDARFAGNPYVQDGMLRFYAGAVLKGRNGHPLGTLCVHDPAPRAYFGEPEQRALRDAAAAIQHRLEQLRFRAYEVPIH